MDIKISPSILSSDYANLESELRRISGADMIHIDVMDGHFVPNITIGMPVIKALKAVCDIPFDVHLMISNPYDYIDSFANAGADIICFHIESESNVAATIDRILYLGKKAAIAIKPDTPVDSVLPYLDKLDMVLVMTVEPGFGGQSFMERVLPKIQEIRKHRADIDIEVDGGVDFSTVSLAAQAGANVFVAGSAVFGSENPNDAIETLKNNAYSANF
ncbi:MAG: ribulose-phosphate 3-epimerase [Eubacterium sp.]|nr:ribulose-phosphate 3-epimerase [Eubacterium sp.]